MPSTHDFHVFNYLHLFMKSLDAEKKGVGGRLLAVGRGSL